MAKADLSPFFTSVHGKLDHNSNVYYAQRFGETVVSHYPTHKDPDKISEKQKQQSNAFRQAVAQATEELTNPERHAYWQEQFNNQPKNQKQYKTLRGFVIAHLTHQ